MDETNPLRYVSKIQDLMDLNDFMQDEELMEALDLALKHLTRPGILPEPKKVAVTISQLSAYALLFQVRSAYWMGINKGKEGASAKKNVYYATYHGLQNLVDSLKYLAKTP